MSRKLRLEYPGAMYHIMNRGDQRADIFRDEDLKPSGQWREREIKEPGILK